jgi:hypothetical protein
MRGIATFIAGAIGLLLWAYLVVQAGEHFREDPVDYNIEDLDVPDPSELDLPEIGACNGTAIATLVGLAAMANDSARRKGCRIHRWWTLARSVPSCSWSPEERPASMMDPRHSTKG